MPFSTAGMKFLGIEPPKISLANSKLLPRGQRLHLDPAIAELAVTAGLLLVAALDVGPAANGFAVGNLRRFQGDIHAVALLQAADHDFDMLLAAAGQQELAGLRVAVEAQGLVFFQDAVDGVAHAVFVVARLGFDGEGDGGLRQFDRRIGDVEALFGQGVAGQGVLELGDGADIAGVQFGDGLQGLAVRAAEVRQAFGGILVDVLQVGVVLNDAGIDAEEVDASGEGVGGGFEDVGGSQAAFGDGAMRFGAVDEGGDLAALGGIRHVVDDQVEDQVAADVEVGGGAHDGEDAHFANAGAHAVENVFHRQGALFEELFHVGIVAFGDHFHQGFVGGLRLVGVLGGDVAFLALTVAIGRVGEGAHANQVDDALEIALGADGEVDGHGGASEVLLDAGEGARENRRARDPACSRRWRAGV